MALAHSCLLIFISAALVTGCTPVESQNKNPEPKAPVAGRPASQPAKATNPTELRWNLHGTSLIHAPDESDAFDVVFECINDEKVELMSATLPPKRELQLQSGNLQKSVSAKHLVLEFFEYDSAWLLPDDEVLKAFASTGNLTIQAKDVSAKFAGEREDIAGFLEMCG